MKWLGAGSGGGGGEPAPPMQLHHPSANGHIPTDSEQCAQVMAGGDGVRIQSGQTHQLGVSRAQDDAMVGYVFQRPMEADFNPQSSAFHNKQTPRTWALADEANIDSSQEKWKYPMNKLGVPQQTQPQQLGLQTMNNVHAMPYEIHPMQLKSANPGTEHLVYLNNQMTAQQQVALFHHQQQQQQQQQQQFRNGQIEEENSAACSNEPDPVTIAEKSMTTNDVCGDAAEVSSVRRAPSMELHVATIPDSR